MLSRDKLAQLRAEQQAGTGQVRVLTDQERLLASEVKQLERQLVALAKTMPRRTQTIALPLLADTGFILPGALFAVAWWWCEGGHRPEGILPGRCYHWACC